MVFDSKATQLLEYQISPADSTGKVGVEDKRDFCFERLLKHLDEPLVSLPWNYL
jgi:hypothetical protein